MTIPTGPNEHAWFQPAFTRQHVGEQRIRRDVERNTQENVGATLIELQVEPPRGDLRLKQAMARCERHPANLAGVPRCHDLATRIRILADELDQVGDLVDVAALGGFPVAPLLAVDRPKVAVVVRPFVPDLDFAIVEPANVGVAAQEPQQFDDDRPQV